MPATWWPQAWIDYWSRYLTAIDATEALAELQFLEAQTQHNQEYYR